MIEDIERFCPELKLVPVGNVEYSDDGSIDRPIAGAYKRVPAEIAHAPQAGGSKEIVRQVEAVGPLGVGGVDIIRDRIRAVVAFAVEIVVAPLVNTLRRIERTAHRMRPERVEPVWGYYSLGMAPSARRFAKKICRSTASQQARRRRVRAGFA